MPAVSNTLGESLLPALRHGCDALELVLTDGQYQQMLEFIALLHKWNKAYNLTAIRDPQSMVAAHLLDSLSIAPFLTGNRLIDVGTGGGLPGVPLAILFPERQFTLLDGNGKKTRFLFQVKQALKLSNITIVNCRVESYRPEQIFEAVISRAFSSLSAMTGGCKHLLSPDGCFYAMKGVFPQSELSELEKHYIVIASHQLTVPGVEGERCLLVIRRFDEQKT